MEKHQNNSNFIQFHIISTSTHASHYLKNTQPVFAQVHSIYSNSINLLFNKQLFTLQTHLSPLSPLSLMTSLTERQFTQLNWHVNDHLLIDFKPDTQCYIYNSTLTANVSAKERSFFYENLAFELLTQTDKPGLSQLLCSMQHRDFLLDNVHHYLTQTHNAFQQKAFQEAAYYLVKLIGIGIGLTPSGDDFLCGVLAALYNLGFQQTIFYKHLSEEIEKQLNRTNDISAAFLHCALQHQYAEFIINFFAVDEQISLVQKQKLLQSFKNIGHSSGIDTLFGIYFITNLLNNLNISVFY